MVPAPAPPIEVCDEEKVGFGNCETKDDDGFKATKKKKKKRKGKDLKKEASSEADGISCAFGVNLYTFLLGAFWQRREEQTAIGDLLLLRMRGLKNVSSPPLPCFVEFVDKKSPSSPARPALVCPLYRCHSEFWPWGMRGLFGAVAVCFHCLGAWLLKRRTRQFPTENL